MATNMARAMVTQYGMSDKLGPLAYGENEEEVFLGHSVTRSKNLSDETQKIVDAEIFKLVDAGYKLAKKILKENAKELKAIAEGLLEYETLTGQEIIDLLAGKKPKREGDDDEPVPGGGSAVPVTGGKKEGGGAPDTGGMEPQPG